ncbi:MAG: UDP-N-acetylmuramate--L-alanine ligase [Pseudanabaenaceae cyanobacterium SKYGB_i_bin29]|nr:UDP-N-acetylmuramate--L-alanine ligase [Pseudanabaenaceae cyanobacterium SKYGB_i_bin29]
MAFGETHELLKPVDFSGRPFHFIGIGGIGMSGIAHILAKKGLTVTGSDIAPNRITRQLEQLGVRIFQGHELQNINVAAQPQVVCSSAIHPHNVELQTALTHNLPVLHRSDVLAALMAQSHSIAVAGTHGKTTTSSLIGFLLLQAGLDPTIVVGGEVDTWEGNARLGQSQYLVAEADESDGSLVRFAPQIGVVTNIELDHPDHYSSLEQVIATFQHFGRQCETLVACVDCHNVRAHLPATITYGLEQAADYTARQIHYRAEGTLAEVWERGQPQGIIQLRILGKHNLLNTLAAIAVARHLGVSWQVITAALPLFAGAKRRFEWKGSYNGITFIDDYAHHPSEIRATLTSAKLHRQHQIVAIFQPHRYSRTQALLQEFAQAFADADRVVITDIYGAGESNTFNISGADVAAAVAKMHPCVSYQPRLSDVQAFLLKCLSPGDLALFLGAGNLNQIITPTLEAMARAGARV